MKIPKELKEAHKHLSAVNVDFLEFAEKNPDCFRESSFRLLDLGDDLIRFQAWPTFINGRTRREFREAAVSVFDLIKTIPRRLFNNDPDKIGAYFNIPPAMVKHQLEGVDQDHFNSLLARGDFVLSRWGLKCIEYNVSASIGGLKLPGWELLYLNTPIIDKFLKDYRVKINNANLLTLLLEHLTRSLPENAAGDNEINIALVITSYKHDKTDTTGQYLNTLYRDVLQRKNSSLKGSVFTCDYPDLDIVDNCVFYKDKKIHILVEMYAGVVPPGIAEVFKMGNMRLINGPVTALMSAKLMLALLSEHENSDAFTTGERETIDKYIPWTRKITPGETVYRGEKVRLEPFILSHKEQLVIKPSDGYGGKDVVVGRKTPVEEWKQVLENALNRENRLVQEFVPSIPALYRYGEEGCEPHETVWGLFSFGSQYGGGLVRTLPVKDNKGIINSHQGATLSVIFEVGE